MDILKVIENGLRLQLEEGKDIVHCGNCGTESKFKQPKYEGFYMVICPKCNLDIQFYTKGSEKLHGK